MKDGHLRLTLVTDSFLPHSGGSRYFYFNLFRRMADQFHDRVTVLTKKVDGWRDFDRTHNNDNFRIERKFEPLSNLGYSQLPKAAGTLMHALPHLSSTDVLHCGDLYPPGLVGLLGKALLSKPFVAYCHGEDITLTDQRHFQPKYRNWIYRRADAIIANGDFAIQSLLRTGIERSKITKITPGLDPNRFYPEQPSPELLQKHQLENKLVLLTIARLVPRKGQDFVIRALPRLKRDYPNLRYLIVGKGPDEQRLRTLARDAAVEDVVEFVGFVPDEMVNKYYNLADLVVMPNRNNQGDMEGFGMVFLEANAAGKPVIAGRSGGAGEAIADGETGLLVDSSSEDAVYQGIRMLALNSRLRSQFGEAGRLRAVRDFDWDSRAELLHEVSCRALAQATS